MKTNNPPLNESRSTNTTLAPGLDWTDRFGLYGLLLVILGSLSLLYVSSLILQKNTATAGHDTWVDNAGRLHVLGIVLGETALRDAEKALKSRSDVALYLYSKAGKEKMLSLEAYFPSIADHSKVVLGLAASEDKLKSMKPRASRPRIYPNGVTRMNLATDDLMDSQTLKVAWIKLVPSMQLSGSMLSARFGTPDQILKIENGIHYIYKSIGLDACVDDGNNNNNANTNNANENNINAGNTLTFMQPAVFAAKHADPGPNL